MKTLHPVLRAAGLVAAALVLPCCRDEIGKGDEINQVTVRISSTPAKVEPNQACVRPSISADGNLVAFESLANNLTPGDSNGLVDIFVRNRINGAIENVTLVVPTGEFPTWFPGSCS